MNRKTHRILPTPRTCLCIPHQIRQRRIRLQANEQMQMIGHTVAGNQLLFLTRDDAAGVFLKFAVLSRLVQVLPAFNGEHDMEVNLRRGV